MYKFIERPTPPKLKEEHLEGIVGRRAHFFVVHFFY